MSPGNGILIAGIRINSFKAKVPYFNLPDTVILKPEKIGIQTYEIT